MAATIGRVRGSSLRVRLFVLLVTFIANVALGQEAPGPAATSRLRAVDAKATALLAAGQARSATFRALTDRIEHSDLLVYVETCQLTLPGQLQFASATHGGRYLRVSVRVQGLDNELLPWLAHELWHAVEIAGAPEVRDRASLLRFYQRIGGGFRAGGSIEMETVKAQETQQTILGELRRSKRQASRPAPPPIGEGK